MNQRLYIPTLRLIAVLNSMSPVMASGAGIALARSHAETPQPGNTQRVTLSEEHLDQVTAGLTDDIPKVLHTACYGGACIALLSDGRYIDWFNIWGGSSFTVGGRTVGNSGPGSQ